MKIKKRKKSSRFRGSHTHGRGFKKKARGSGHQGGKGMAGTGKRADQKKTLILNLPEPYFGKDRALRAGKKPKKLQVIDLKQIDSNLDLMLRKGTAKESKGVYEISLKGYKILGDGDLKIKVHIIATSASKSAIEKIKSAGSTIEFDEEIPAIEKKAEVKENKKSKVQEDKI